jgi:hypothetical protein
LKKITGIVSSANNLQGSGTGIFQNDYQLSEIDLICDTSVAYALRNCFYQAYNFLKNKKEIFDFKEYGINTSKVTVYWNPFPSNIEHLKEINFEGISGDSANNYIYCFTNNSSLIDIQEIGTISLSGFNFSNCQLLNHDTLIRILDALYDYSDSEDTYTITLGTVNLAKLTDEEKAIATEKGWTLS